MIFLLQSYVIDGQSDSKKYKILLMIIVGF